MPKRKEMCSSVSIEPDKGIVMMSISELHDFKGHPFEYSVTSEPLNPLHRATHSECRSHPYEKVNPLLRATS